MTISIDGATYASVLYSGLHDPAAAPLTSRPVSAAVRTPSDAVGAAATSPKSSTDTDPAYWVAAGIWHGIVGTAKGVVDVVTHPVQTAQAIGTLVEAAADNPSAVVAVKQAAKAIFQSSVVAPIQQYGVQEGTARVAGDLGFNVFAAFAGGAAVGGGADLADAVAQVGSRAADWMGGARDAFRALAAPRMVAHAASSSEGIGSAVELTGGPDAFAELVGQVDRAMDAQYGYGLAQPGSFGHQALEASVAAAINAFKSPGGATVDQAAAAVHEGWGSVVSRTADDLALHGSPEKLLQRQSLAEQSFADLSPDEQEKDVLIAREVKKFLDARSMPP